LGELERDKTLERVLVREPRAGGLEVRIGRLVVDVSGDSSLADVLVFWTWRTGIEEKCSGCCRGSPLLGEVMDSVDGG
jgi:hypothetical protein